MSKSPPPGPALSALRLVALCCAPPAAAERNRGVITALAQDPGLDWDAFEHVVTRHRVAGIVLNTLVALAVEIPGSALQFLRSEAAKGARAALSLLHASCRIQQLLDAHGINALILKGATLDILAWSGAGVKQSWDIDVLVSAADVLDATAALRSAGYELISPEVTGEDQIALWVSLSMEMVLRHVETGITVELHTRLTDMVEMLPDLHVGAPAQTLRVQNGMSLRTLESSSLLLYLGVHGASHAWARLKWLADFTALFLTLTREDQDGLLARARTLQAGLTTATALLMMETQLGVPAPAEAWRIHRRSAKCRILLAFQRYCLSFGLGRRDALQVRWLSDAIRLSWVLCKPGAAYTFKALAAQWISVDDHMRLNLPPGRRWIYPLIRLPLWVWRRTPFSRP